MRCWSMFKGTKRGEHDDMYELDTATSEDNKWRSKAQMREAKINYIIEQLKDIKGQCNLDTSLAIHNLLKEIT